MNRNDWILHALGFIGLMLLLSLASYEITTSHTRRRSQERRIVITQAYD